MADTSGFTILDGTELRSGDLRIPITGGAVNGKRVVEMAEAEVAARLFGLSLPDYLKSAVLRRLGDGADSFLSIEFNEAELQKKIQEYLLALAEELEDINDTGKLSKSKIEEVLAQMGAEMVVPPFSAFGDLLSNIMKRHGIEGEEQLGQAQFAQVLQPILQDLADSLAEKHVAIIKNSKVINGSRLKKIINNEKLLDDITGRLFHEWQENGNGAWNKETLASLLQAKSSELGLPPYKSNEKIGFLFDQIFSNASQEKIAGDWNKESFQDEVKAIFKMLTELLEANPIFIDRES